MTEKYLDFSFEKTNSAYMLFYERRASEKKEKNVLSNTPSCSSTQENENSLENSNSDEKLCKSVKKRSLLSKELEDWIWQDNRHYLEDRNIFEHTYFK